MKLRKRTKKRLKALSVLLAMGLVLGGIVGGTIAWLTDSTAEVKNTFTTSKVDIELTETAGGEDREFKMIPGCTIAKDPKVTVLGGSEKCWLFVKAEKSENFDTFMTYAVSNGWNQGNGTDIPANVYYREVQATEDNQIFDILEGDTVTVKETVTKADMDALAAGSATLPTLTFTAYACQFTKGNGDFTAAEAWAKINPAS